MSYFIIFYFFCWHFDCYFHLLVASKGLYFSSCWLYFFLYAFLLWHHSWRINCVLGQIRWWFHFGIYHKSSHIACFFHFHLVISSQFLYISPNLLIRTVKWYFCILDYRFRIENKWFYVSAFTVIIITGFFVILL